MPQGISEAFLLSKNNTFQNNSLYFLQQLPVITKAVWLISNENEPFQKIPGNMSLHKIIIWEVLLSKFHCIYTIVLSKYIQVPLKEKAISLRFTDSARLPGHIQTRAKN